MDQLSKRLEALREYEILDTAPERSFDDIAKLASAICGTPIATVTLLDEHRQWFKAAVGTSDSENPINHGFCIHAIGQEDVFEVEDAMLDTRFAANPLVTGRPNIRFYAGAPLVNPEGIALGT